MSFVRGVGNAVVCKCRQQEEEVDTNSQFLVAIRDLLPHANATSALRYRPFPLGHMSR